MNMKYDSSVGTIHENRVAAERIYEELESVNWAPWLQFNVDDISTHRDLFPEGQVTIMGEEGHPVVSLDTIRTNWSGNSDELPSWDSVAGKSEGYDSVLDVNGNAIALLSMSVKKDSKGKGFARMAIGELQDRFKDSGVEYIIGDFRPSGFGQYKKDTGRLDFVEYVSLNRDDGFPFDGWLRSVEKSGGEFIKIDPRAMVVHATLGELQDYQSEYRPDDWYQLSTDDEQVVSLTSWHKPDLDIDNIDEIWECEETGTWYVDRANEQAVYIESNVWGRLPLTRESSMSSVLGLTGEVKIEEVGNTVDSGYYDYDLSDERLRELESKLVTDIKDNFDGREGVFIAWVDSSHGYSNIIRSLEAKQFPEIVDLVDDTVERLSKFMAIVDTRPNAGRIIHASRLTGEKISDGMLLPGQNNERTGFVAIDEIINSEQGVTASDFRQYYGRMGMDLSKCVAVETNFRVGDRVKSPVEGVRISDFGYLSIFNAVDGPDNDMGQTAVFANINRASILSLNAIGISFMPLMGREDIKTPTTDSEGNIAFDDDYRPVVLPSIKNNAEIFRNLAPFGLDEISFR